jgi:hypothetical protein
MRIGRSTTTNMNFKLVLPALLSVTLLLSGCYEEKDSITVFADGSGVLHFHKKFGEAYSQEFTSNGTRANLQAALDKELYKELALWSGVTAWTGCKASLDGKLVVNEAAAYFADVSALKRIEGTNAQTFSWTKNSDGGFTLCWTNGDPSNPNLLDQPSPTPEQLPQILTMVKGLKVEHEIILPGPVSSAVGAPKQSGRTASAALTDQSIADYYVILDSYRAKVAKGEMPKAQASSEISAKAKAMSMNMQVTCGPSSAKDEFTAFKQAFEVAKADYSAAHTAQKILDATKG